MCGEDCYLQGDLSTECAANFIMVIGVLEGLGFYINRDKSEKNVQGTNWFLKFIIGFLHMTLEITIEKKQKNLIMCLKEKLAH